MNIHTTVYAYGGVSGACINSQMAFTQYVEKHKIPCITRTVREDALISRSRSRETAVAVASGADVWMQIDHDISFDPEDVIEMCKRALDMKAAVCGVYSCRSLPPRCALRPIGSKPITKVGVDEMVPITFFASGFVAIPMESIIKTISLCEGPDVPTEYKIEWVVDDASKSFKSQYPTLWKPMSFQRENKSYEYLSEDYSASARLRLAGVDQYAWLKPKLSHWGEFPYRMPTE